MSKPSTRERLIEVGLRLLRSAGYSAAGINQILQAAEIPKGSFYHHFSTKDEFVIEVIERYATGEMERLERNIQSASLSPLKKLRAYFKDLIATYGQRGGPISGCLLGNLSLEVGGQNEEIRTLLESAFSAWQKELAKIIREAIDAKELPRTVRPDDLAALLVNGWEGAQVRAKATQSDKPLELFFNYTFNVLLKP
ncbi:TetR family transcriptional regulator C-terminal domain-containing protein [Granulicella cerasi]|uniref:TetR family transcriptional regulator C-terminal domain-containing protein n=1 Tax=Granulicella cerasi TaxID=741063 RepID=A0ABW1Z5Z5_9BACT|nr:TetR/AcrR family transcriptional regulator [Granulicella cerasi]